MTKRKKHGYSERLKYMHMLEDGYSIKCIHKKYGIGRTLLERMWKAYQSEGESALGKKKYVHASPSFRLKVIRDYEENHLTLVEAMSKYDLSESALYQWRKKYHSGGIEALNADGRGRPPGMGRPKKKTAEQMTELERLQKENQELKTELALLKKVRALVEERNARLREIGQGPSKN